MPALCWTCNPCLWARFSPPLSVSQQHFTDERNPELVSNAMQIQGGYGDDPYWQVLSEEAGGSWNSLGHRRVHSAPNIMERMGELSGPAASRVGDLGLLMPCSDLLEPDVVDRTIPEGRRYQVSCVSRAVWTVTVPVPTRRSGLFLCSFRRSMYLSAPVVVASLTRGDRGVTLQDGICLEVSRDRQNTHCNVY